MSRKVLLISTMRDGKACAVAMAEQLDVPVEFAAGRREGLSALRREDYSVVVIEESLAEADPDWADLAWQQAGTAVPMEVNFAISARTRLVREVRGALARRQHETDMARREAAAAIGSELKGSVTGLLLQTQLTLREPGVPPMLAPKLQHLVELATEIRERLRGNA